MNPRDAQCETEARGDLTPYFTAFDAGLGREVGSESCAGRRLVLVFHYPGPPPW
ncbi:hypothetical protein BH24ACT19_BH24ACT19_00740 [soil metagenome]